jgi:acyl-CoA hydrolase
MDWQSEYKKRVVSASEAVSVVKSSDRIFHSGNGATPYLVLRELALRYEELFDVEVNHLLLLGEDPFAKPEMRGHFRHNSQFVGSADRPAIADGRGDYIPVHLSEVPGLFSKKIIPLDVAILHATVPDNHGYMSLGVECAASLSAAQHAKVVIVQANERMPRTLGDVFIHASQVDRIVECSEPLVVRPTVVSTDVEKRIARHIAELVEDGSTLQLGIGGIPDEVLRLLDGKRNLGIHTEMVSDGVMMCIEKGIITNKKKTHHPGKVISTFVLGSEELYKYVDNNPYFELHPCNYTNNISVIVRNEKMVAINSAIEVDITGQVCSDSIGPRIFSGFGGQLDFIRGAAGSLGGKPIIAIASTAKKGTVSRIAPHLKLGAGVVTTRADVHYVVTEFGVANLHGKNLSQRAEALIQIAHPDFRSELETAFKAGEYLKPIV